MKPRVHDKYTEESVRLPYTPVEGYIMKFWCNTSEFICIINDGIGWTYTIDLTYTQQHSWQPN